MQFILHSIGCNNRSMDQMQKKWFDLKHQTLQTYAELKNTLTGGGHVTGFDDVQMILVNYYVDRKSGKIKGVAGGIDSMVRLL